jgi:hypothetical protein
MIFAQIRTVYPTPDLPNRGLTSWAICPSTDQFRRNIRMKLKDADDHRETDLDAEIEAAFSQVSII